MSEKRKRNYRYLVLKSLALFFALLSIASASGCGYRVVAQIDGYRDFLKNYTKYYSGKDDPNRQEPEELASIIGFDPVCNYAFDFGKSFFGEYAFVRKGNKSYLLGKDGALSETSEAGTDGELIGDKCIFECDGKKGVKILSTGESIDAKYDGIQIAGKAVLATVGNRADFYINGKKISSANFSNYAILESEDYIICDGVCCNHSFMPFSVCGYVYADVPSEGIAIISLDSGLFGYADIEKNVLIGKGYVAASPFSEGVAVAIDSERNTVVIDKNGKVLHTTRDIILANKHENYFCYYYNGMGGLLDANFTPLELPWFNKIYYDRVFSNCLIVYENGKYSLYSLTANSYVIENCDSIKNADSAFICSNGNEMLLIDGEGNILLTCEEADFSEGILTVRLDGKYAYYKRRDS